MPHAMDSVSRAGVSEDEGADRDIDSDDGDHVVLGRNKDFWDWPRGHLCHHWRRLCHHSCPKTSWETV